MSLVAKASVTTSPSLREIVLTAVYRLQQAGTPNPQLEAELLMAKVLDIPRLALQLQPEHRLSEPQSTKFADFLSRREHHEPVQYITGFAAFRELELAVGRGCLIPRPETEELVELALRSAPKNARVLDLGTGSGAIALSLAEERKDLRLCACDNSPAALNWVTQNRARFNLQQRVEIINSELLAGLTVENRDFALIIANLPYIPEGDWPSLPREVREWEPREALIAGADGLNLIRSLIIQAPEYLSQNGKLLLEIDPRQQQAIAKTAENAAYHESKFFPDLTGRVRYAQLTH